MVVTWRKPKPLGDRPPLMRMDGVDKVFPGGITALRGMDLQVNEGDFVSLLGPSGCGKSTALRLIAGLMQPTRGAIHWEGGTAEIGVVFQEPTLMPWATVEENIYLPFRLKGRRFVQVAEDIRLALRLVGLEGFGKAYPRALSGGMKMRVSIARAMVTRPRLILMDEPFAALDEITRHKLNNDLLELKEKIASTVIFVTHSVFESVFLSDRIVIMAACPGRVFHHLTVDAPYPRGEDFRTSANYAGLCRTTSDALHAAMEEPA